MARATDPAHDDAAPAVAARRARGWLRALSWMTLGAAATVATAVLALVLALPAIERHPELAASWIAEQLDREVRLREMEVAWHDGAPVLRLRGLVVGGADGIALDDTEVRVAPLASLRAGALRPATVTVRGAAIVVERGADGTVTVAGLGKAQRAPSGKALGGAVGRALGAALSMLPRPAELSLEGASVTLTGLAPDGAPILLAPVSLRLNRAEGMVRVAGSVASADAPRQPARFSLRWPHDSADPLARVDATLSIRELALSSLPAALWGRAVDGLLTLDLDGRIDDGQLATLRGSAVLARPRLHGRAQALGGIESVDGLIEFQRGSEGWHLDLLRLRPRTSTRAWPATRGRIAYRAAARDAPWRVELAGAPMAELLPLLGELPLEEPAARAAVAALAPQGRVEALALELPLDFGSPRLVSLEVRGLRLRGADGRIEAGPVDAALSLVGPTGRLRMLRAPLRITPPQDAPVLNLALAGEFSWQRDAAGVAFSSPELRLSDGESRLVLGGRVRLPAAEGQPVTLALAARGETLEVDTLKRYLALPGLPERLRDWLDTSLSGGRLRALAARVEGEADTLAAAVALLDASAGFEQLSLRYLSDWPALAELSGELTLREGALAFRVDGGKVNGASIVSASGGIADVSGAEQEVTVSGQVAGSTAQATGFITDTPLGRRFPGLLPLLVARGNARVDIRMAIPIGPARTRLEGSIRLADNTLGVPGLRSPLTGVKGTIGFDRDGLGTGTLEARYLDRRIAAKLDGGLDDHERTRLTISGRTDRGGLLRHLYDVGAIASDRPEALPLLSRLDGETAWQVVMDIPHRHDLGREGIALTVSSDLEGMALELPAPLGKGRAAAQPLAVRTRLATPGERVFEVEFGDRIRAVLRASASGADEQSFRFDRGELRFGGERATLPEEPGLRVTGSVETISVDDWVAFIAQAAAGDAAGDGGGALATVNGIAVAAQRLDVLGAAFDEVALRARRDGDRTWVIAVRGAGLDGTITVPWPIGSKPIDARFDHLHVRREAGGVAWLDAGTQLEPAELPPARLVARRLRYNDVDLGVAKLTLSRGAGGLLVEELVAVSEDFEVRGSGSWARSGGETTSQVDLRIHSSDFGALTTALGYGDSGVDGGVAEISLRANWQGSPFDLALDRITGVLRFHAGGGHLREVERGTTGRMFGLLNVTVLPRRLLRLDFSDLFDEGVAYQSLQGSFRLAGGNAWTDDVVMHTENARVDLIGRVGLVAEDYEQVMTVTPKLSTSLPLAPLWLAEKFLNRKLIDGAFAYRYIITGPWSEPLIRRERIEAEPTEAG